MRTLLSLLLAIMTLTLGATPRDIPREAPFIPEIDMDAAKAYCDTMPIRDPEGIYLWPERGALVLLRACGHTGGASTAFEIINLESSDILVPPGQVTGYLFSSPDAEDFHLYIYDHIGPDAVTSPKHMAAKFDPMQQRFEFKEKKTHLSVNLLALIPRMRSLLRVKTENPAADIPDGMRRIYPAPVPTPANPAITYPRYF